MANPPFMSPSGGIRPHKRFSVQANRAEVLFVDYIKEHLRPNGRAGIIVPEGIIFKTDTASIQLRKILVEDGLWAVVSMPVGIFNPYSSTIKTSILFFDTQKAKTEKELLFITIENDGYDLGAQRLKIDKNDLPEATELLNGWKLGKKHKSRLSMWVSKNDILKSGDYTLTLNRYAEKTDHSKVKFPIVKLQDICEIKTGRKNVNQGNPNGKYPFFTCAREHTFSDSYSFDTEAILIAGNGDVGVVKYYKGKFEAYQRTYVLLNFKGVVARYLYFILANSLREAVKKQKLGNTMAYIKLGMLQTYQIPLPPVEIQKNFITQIENEQRQIEANEKMIEKQKQNIR